MEALGKKRRQRSASDVFNGGVVRLHGRCRHLLNILASVYHRLLHVGIVPTQFNKDARYYLVFGLNGQVTTASMACNVAATKKNKRQAR